MTTMFIIPPVGAAREIEVPDLPVDPGYDRLKALIEPHLGGDRLERVACLHPDFGPVDMFVGEFGAINGSPVNVSATAIYRNNWLTQHPEDAAESLPAIHGPAVLFDRQVWF